MTAGEASPALPYLLDGAVVTLWLTVVCVLTSSVAGVLVAVTELYAWRPVRLAMSATAFGVRGIPVLVLLIGFYFGLPTVGVETSPLISAIAVLTIYFGAYLGDVFRSALASVPVTQFDASRSLGMRRHQLYLHVILPQCVRIALPPYLNQCLRLLKNTSLASVVGVRELALSGDQIVNRDFAVMQTYLTVAAIYFALCYPISAAARHLERRLARGG